MGLPSKSAKRSERKLHRSRRRNLLIVTRPNTERGKIASNLDNDARVHTEGRINAGSTRIESSFLARMRLRSVI
jgi:hypothetical protein